MRIEKISTVKHDYHESIGPSETLILGLKCDDQVFILGKYYYGPHMNNSVVEHRKKTEEIIDYIVSNCRY